MVNRNYGWNPTGQLLSTIIASNPSIAVFADNFRHCLAQVSPVTVIDNFQGYLGTPKCTVGIIAPLAGPDGAISDLICCSFYLRSGDPSQAERELSALSRATSNGVSLS